MSQTHTVGLSLRGYHVPPNILSLASAWPLALPQITTTVQALLRLSTAQATWSFLPMEITYRHK